MVTTAIDQKQDGIPKHEATTHHQSNKHQDNKRRTRAARHSSKPNTRSKRSPPQLTECNSGHVRRRSEMLIIVRLLNAGSATGRQLDAEVEGDDLVQVLRTQIERLATPLLSDADRGRLSAAPSFQALYFQGTLLEDGHKMADYGVQHESEVCAALRVHMVVRVDIGGACFSVSLDTLMAVPGSKLRSMFEPLLLGDAPVECGGAEVPEGVPNEQPRPLIQGPDGAYLIERDGHSFRYVVDFLRSQRSEFRNGVSVGRADVPAVHVLLPESSRELQLLASEARWYGLAELVEQVEAQLGTIAREQERAAAGAARVEQLHAVLEAQTAELAELRAAVAALPALREQVDSLQAQLDAARPIVSERLVHQRVLFGLVGQEPVSYSADDGYKLICSAYQPFNGYADRQTPKLPGYERRYRLRAVYSDNINRAQEEANPEPHTVRFSIGHWGNADKQVSFHLPITWGDASSNPMSWTRDAYSEFISEEDVVGGHHAKVEASVAVGKATIRQVVLESWDCKPA